MSRRSPAAGDDEPGSRSGLPEIDTGIGGENLDDADIEPAGNLLQIVLL